MDLNSLKDQVSNLTLYDLKAGVRKVQNGKPAIGTTAEATADMPFLAVMNYTEMEAKVGNCNIKIPSSLLITSSRSEKLPTTSHGALHRHSCRKLPMAHTASMGDGDLHRAWLTEWLQSIT